MSTFPSVLTSYTNPNATDRLNAPSHSAIEQAQNSGASQLEKVIGVEGANSVVGTIQYLVKSPASNGGGHVQTANTGGTGQTSYSKGDMLVAQSASVLAKLAIGVDGQALFADSSQSTGVRWGGRSSLICGVSSTLVYTKSATTNYLIVTAIGAGGSGGCGNGVSAGYGGGAGGFSQQLIPAGGITSVLVKVGAGGAAQSTFNTVGSGGGNTTFGNIMIVGGGGPGGTSAAGSNGAAGSVAGLYSVLGVLGGQGGSFASHDAGGAGGGTGAANAVTSVAGTNSSLNGHGGLAVNGASGNPGSVYGGGGAGCPETFTSGAGAPGYISIIEF